MAKAANESRANRAGNVVLQLKLSLRGVSKPPVWRRLLVPADMRLSKLHDVIQVAMGWTDTHLHAFSTPYGTTVHPTQNSTTATNARPA